MNDEMPDMQKSRARLSQAKRIAKACGEEMLGLLKNQKGNY